MAQSVMTRVIDGTFAGYGLKLAPDSEMPANRRLPGEIDLAKRVSRVRQVFSEEVKLLSRPRELVFSSPPTG